MKLCIPIKNESGLDSPVSEHFGSAPYFLVVDSATQDATLLSNGDREHEHGKCNPTAVVKDINADAVVACGMGMRAVQALNSMGIDVYRCDKMTAGEVVRMFVAGNLPIMTTVDCCSHSENHCG